MLLTLGEVVDHALGTALALEAETGKAQDATDGCQAAVADFLGTVALLQYVPFWVLPSLTPDCFFSSLLFSHNNDTYNSKYLIITFQYIYSQPPLYPYDSLCVASIFLPLLFGTCPVLVRFYTGHIPDIYRTYTVHLVDMYRGNSLVVTLFHWDCLLDKWELFLYRV